MFLRAIAFCLLPLPAIAETPLTGAEFEALTTGKTMDHVLFGEVYGAERYFPDDPSTALLKLRQYAEVMAKLVAAKIATYAGPEETLSEILRRLKADRILPPPAADLFHRLKTLGNRAAHDLGGNHAEALQALKFARELGIWFHKSFANEPNFKSGAFVPPKPPADPSA